MNPDYDRIYTDFYQFLPPLDAMTHEQREPFKMFGAGVYDDCTKRITELERDVEELETEKDNTQKAFSELKKSILAGIEENGNDYFASVQKVKKICDA
jgi:hypothetical protein